MINVDDVGTPQTVRVRVYQLKGKEKFQQATFKALWKTDKDVLEGDLLQSTEFVVYPDKEDSFDLPVDVKHGAAYLGIMALFRQPDVEGWRQIIEASSSMLNPMTPKVRVRLDKNSIKLVD